MLPRHRSLCPTLLAIAVALACPSVRAELIKVSPFLTPQNAAGVPAANAPLQYMGWIDTAEGRLFRVYDPARKIGSFLKMGEHDANLDVIVKQHDDDHDTLTVDRGGQSLTLPEHDSKVASAGMFPQMMPSPMPNVSPAVIQTVVPNPTPADEQRRLEAVAQEVARRRALREQAQQQAQMQGAQPMPPPQYPGNQRANRRER